MNPDLKKQLARAFGLASTRDVDDLIACLRSGGSVDPAVLRNGCLTLVQHLQEERAANAARDRRMKLALEGANVGLWDWDLVTDELFVDHTYFAFLGEAAEDRTIPMAEFIERVHPEDLPAFMKATQDAVRGHSPMLLFPHRMRHADGRWVWIETCGNATARDSRNYVTRMTGTQRNITERKQLERALSDTLRVMHALLETLPTPVIMRDANRRVTLVNAAWEKMLGIPRQSIVGRHIEDFTGIKLSDNHRESDDSVLQTRQPMRYETIVHGIDGSHYDVIVAKTPLVSDDGSVTGLAAVVTDISDQKRTAEALEKARQSAEAAMHAKSRFLANMSHELRTPLNGVVGMASLIENTALDTRQRRFVRTLRASAEALVTLINDVLDLSKAEAGKLEVSSTPFELRRELEQVVNLFSARAHEKGIELATHIARDVPAVIHGDPIRLRQVVGNLVNNAVKFTEAGAVLLSVAQVDTDDSQCTLEFAVTDTGVGVAPAEQQRIFEAFEQADGSVTRKYGGTGLGLAISRQLVDLMHGTMGLRSEPGGGSRFHFRIPAGVPRGEAAVPARAPELGAIVIGLHAAVQGVVTETLSAECAKVVHVDSAGAAIEAFAGFGPQYRRLRVLIDSSATARLDHAVSGLRAAAGSRQLEIVALLPPDAESNTSAGVTRSLVKPLCTPDLVSTPSADATQTLRVRALPATGGRGRALVVEDNAVNQEMARAMLDMIGFQVFTASNGQEGVDAAMSGPGFDVIFMDCQMPVMDGLSATRAIRAAEGAGPRVPIVALTGNAMPGDREACFAAGMDDYLAKPFSLGALRAIVDKWTET